MTKDERFLLELYKFLLAEKNPDGAIDPNVLKKSLNFSEHIQKTILKGLMQANLVRRYSSDEIGLTERGKQVAEQLLK